jgi:hypothetical protein
VDAEIEGSKAQGILGFTDDRVIVYMWRSLFLNALDYEGYKEYHIV